MGEVVLIVVIASLLKTAMFWSASDLNTEALRLYRRGEVGRARHLQRRATILMWFPLPPPKRRP